MRKNQPGKPEIGRYKMFKSGKHWVYAGITLASVSTSLLLTTNAQADTVTSTAPTSTTAVVAANVATGTPTQAASATSTTSESSNVSSPAANSNNTSDNTSNQSTDGTTNNQDTASDTNTNTNTSTSTATAESASDNQTTPATTTTDQTTGKQTATSDAANNNAAVTSDTDTTVKDSTNAASDTTNDNNTATTDTTTTTDTTNVTPDTTTPAVDTAGDAANADAAATENTTNESAAQPATTTDTTGLADDLTANDNQQAATPVAEALDVTATSAATDPVAASNAALSAVASLVSELTGVQISDHGPIYTTDDSTLDNQGTITVEKTGPYAITWKSVSSTNQTSTKTVTIDLADFVALYKAATDGTASQAIINKAKEKLATAINNLKELPSTIASKVVGSLLYQMIFTGSGSEALSEFRTMLDPTRYSVSDFWEGLDPVAYAADREAAQTYYPEAVTWWNNVTKETWELPEYNDATKLVRATYIQNGNSTKTVVIGQGWTQKPDWIGYVSKIWYDMGYNILMPSQRGQFLSDGNDMTFGYQDKYDWLNWVKMVDARNGANSEVVFYGQSLGADTVIEAASVPGLSKSVKAVIADAGYSTLQELGSSLYAKAVAAVSAKLVALGLPSLTDSLPLLPFDKVYAAVNSLLESKQGFGLDDVSGVAAAAGVQVPLMLIHTEDDQFIPYTQSLELAAANKSALQTVWLLPGQVGGHASANDAILQYTAHIKAFLAEALAAAGVEVPTTDGGNTTTTTGDTTTTDSSSATAESGNATSDTTTNGSSSTTTTGNNGNQTATNDDLTTVDGSKATDVDTGETTTNTTGKTSSTTKSSTNTATGTSATNNSANATSTVVTTADDLIDSNNDALVTDDQSGSVVTASLLTDHTTADDLIAPVSARYQTSTNDLLAATNTADVDTAKASVSAVTDTNTTKPTAAKAATTAQVLPQTTEKSQSWFAALGASLMALVTGAWVSLRRRFNKNA
ncbi:KxYKxGKxW signal peptide domain-containing protein [Lactiplantibacillus fabifermentans]|uniref:Cell surface hydrolase n=2 Tax=Lactiplantibacillus fabifermentans TaxID=483011 RepID=A0A0R2NUC6_9LACO|nr:KxYKxGKxW signal peptide domain-containing protein [Lactiplantibacillus fabifermentans]ETY74816.1 hydrolase [Lactiplantibacillus fabifermentans T30PCM01]KRO28402.1 cell surface hydrolase [Lactiplantibacillus fabifermentans DSM 21115]